MSSNIVRHSNDKNNFPNTQVLRFHKPFANNCSAYMKLSKTQLHKIGQSGELSSRLLRP